MKKMNEIFSMNIERFQLNYERKIIQYGTYTESQLHIEDCVLHLGRLKC